jgi:hypothetical protein
MALLAPSPSASVEIACDQALTADQVLTADQAITAIVESIVRTVELRSWKVPRATIEQAATQEWLRFQDARVTQYIPVLVERAVLTRFTPLDSIGAEDR